MLLKLWREHSGLTPRILTGLAAALLFFATPFLSIYLFQIVMWICAALAAREWIRMVAPATYRQEDIFAAYALIAVFALVGILINPLVSFTLVLLCVLLIAGAPRYSLTERVWLAAGLFYVVVPIFFLSYVTEPLEILFLLLGVAAADIGAFFVGKSLGGPRLWPEVSPKKTWSGFLGGLILAALAGWLFAALAGSTMPGMTVLAMILVALAGQAGDLLESRIKRHHKIKDTGNLLPGHGGILDRVDGYLLAAPLFVLALKLFETHPW